MKGRIKRDKKLLPLLIIALLLIMVGTSYAIWTYTQTGSTNTISTSQIELEFLESDDEIISIQNALPMSDANGKAQAQTFDFAVTSKTTRDMDIEYTLSIEKLTPDTGYTSLNDNQIKVYLTNYSNTQVVAPTLVSNLTNYQLYKGIHSHDSTHQTIQDKFKLRVWIDGTVSVNSWTSSTKLQYKFKINISSQEYVAPVENAVYSFDGNDFYLGDVVSNGYIYDVYDVRNDSSIVGNIEYAKAAVTDDYTTLNKLVFMKHVLDDDNKVIRMDGCFVKDNTLYCLKGNESDNVIYNSSNPAPYYQENVDLLLDVFGEFDEDEWRGCEVFSDSIECHDPVYNIGFGKNNNIFDFLEEGPGCYIDTSGSACSNYT